MADDDVLKILLASDIHLGIHERDPIRREDARTTFGESALCFFQTPQTPG